jgi:hypothetical protein
MKFPVEILIQLFLSFLLVAFGSISTYCKFENIYTDKQNVEKRMKFIPKLANSTLSSKGGMINYFCKDYVDNVNHF